MTDIVQADIFFFVTTIAVVVVAIAVVVISYYVVKILQEVQTMMRSIKLEMSHLIVKRRKIETSALTFTKVLQAVITGKLFRNRNRHTIEK